MNMRQEYSNPYDKDSSKGKSGAFLLKAAKSLSSGLVFRGAVLEATPATREPHGAGAPRFSAASRVFRGANQRHALP